jgi:hypothetical protein
MASRHARYASSPIRRVRFTDQPRLRAGEGRELEQLPRRAVRTAAMHSGGELCLKLGLADALGLCD